MEFPEACHPNASCKTFQFQRMKISKDNWGFTDATINRCVCDSGFIGNGVTCANATTGKCKLCPAHTDFDPTLEKEL